MINTAIAVFFTALSILLSVILTLALAGATWTVLKAIPFLVSMLIRTAKQKRLR